MLDLADYFAAQAEAAAFRADAARRSPAQKKAEEVVVHHVPPGRFAGRRDSARRRQHPEYVIKQLKAFKARTRTNDAGSMDTASQPDLTEQDIEDSRNYISTLD